MHLHTVAVLILPRISTLGKIYLHQRMYLQMPTDLIALRLPIDGTL